jgi:hypothetical protein
LLRITIFSFNIRNKNLISSSLKTRKIRKIYSYLSSKSNSFSFKNNDNNFDDDNDNDDNENKNEIKNLFLLSFIINSLLIDNYSLKILIGELENIFNYNNNLNYKNEEIKFSIKERNGSFKEWIEYLIEYTNYFMRENKINLLIEKNKQKEYDYSTIINSSSKKIKRRKISSPNNELIENNNNNNSFYFSKKNKSKFINFYKRRNK